MSEIKTTDSILLTVKKMLGGAIAADDTTFDIDLIVNINSTLRILNQIGIGVNGYSITSSENTWDEFLANELDKFEMIKTYVYFKVKKMFDPPTSSAVAQAMNDNIQELEWRLHGEANYGGIIDVLK